MAALNDHPGETAEVAGIRRDVRQGVLHRRRHRFESLPAGLDPKQRGEGGLVLGHVLAGSLLTVILFS